MRSWLPPGHLAWPVIEVTGQADLAGFAAACRADGQRQAPYDPAMMRALLLSCYVKAIRSSRKIAAACIDDVGCLVICGGARPSHQAVVTFIRRHRRAIKGLFVQVLSLLAAEGAVGGPLAAMIAAALANCELAGLAGRIRAWLAGSGYASAATFTDLDHLMLLAAARNEAAQAGRGDGRATVPPGWEKMAARPATPAGQKPYARRAAPVEPAFAQFFARSGRYVNYRGRDAVDAEIKLLATVHNLAKLLDHRRRHPALAT
jgi:transposase